MSHEIKRMMTMIADNFDRLALLAERQSKNGPRAKS
jgi:hypothetical protein